MVASIKSGLDIQEVLEDMLQYTSLKFTKEEWDIMHELFACLSPVKDVLDVICRRDADLLEAEIVFKELFKTLESLATPLSLKLLEALKIEIGKRWQSDLAGLLKYLNDPSDLLEAEEQQKQEKRRKRPSSGKHIIFTTYITFVIYIVKDDFSP